MYRPEGVDLQKLVELAVLIGRTMSRELHAEIEPFADLVLRAGVKDAETIRAGALELADRVTLLATGDVIGAITFLCPPGQNPADAMEGATAVARLVRVVLSERFNDARRSAGVA
jgi:hypothetical protein